MTDPRIQLPGTVPGIDLSGWNRVTDYDAVIADGVQFCWIKSSEGNRRDAKRASEHARGLEEGGMCAVGAYHFAIPSGYPDDPAIEAESFLRQLDDLDVTGLRPALDYEEETPDDFDDERWMALWVVRVLQAIGVLPGLYVGRLARRGKVDIERVWRLVAEMTGLAYEHVREAMYVWSPRYPTAKGTPIEVFQRLAIEQIDRGPRTTGWDVWQWSSSWSPRWSPGHIDVNAARDLDAIRWQL